MKKPDENNKLEYKIGGKINIDLPTYCFAETNKAKDATEKKENNNWIYKRKLKNGHYVIKQNF